MIHSIIDPRFRPATAINQVWVWDPILKAAVPSVSLSGLTLNSPVIAENFSWTGDDVNLDCSNLEKTVSLGATGSFAFQSTEGNLLDMSTVSVAFGNDTTNPTFNFLGTGTTSMGGDLDVTGNITTGQYIGDIVFPELIEVDGAGGVVTVDGNVRIGSPAASVYTLEVAGVVKSESGRIPKTTRLTADGTTLGTTQHEVFCDTDGGAFTVTLPAAPVGQTYRIHNTGSSYLTVGRNGNNIKGQAADATIASGNTLIITWEPTEGWW